MPRWPKKTEDGALADAFAEPLAADVMRERVNAYQVATDAELSEGLDIPAEALLNPVSQTLAAKPVYRWEIPGGSGYSLQIDVTDADGPEEARAAALAYRPAAGEDERDLTPLETNWIATVVPLIVRDTTAVTLEHNEILIENERLRRENQAFRDTRKVFAEVGIDVFNPQAWIDKSLAEAASVVKAATDVQDRQRQALAATLERFQAELDATINATGHATPKPIPALEPDYSALTVIVGDLVEAQRYPRLAAANFITRDPSEPLTEEEEQGIALLTNDIHWRRSTSTLEAAALRSGQAKIRALVGM